MMKKIYKISGMECPSCAALLECDLEDMGISAKCDYAKGVLGVDLINPDKEKDVLETVKKSGYNLEEI